MDDTHILRLFEIVTGALERNTSALEGVAKAVTSNAEKNEHLGKRMDKMTAVITGAQRKIGGEIGPVIDRMKDTQSKLEAERREVARAGSQATGRSGSDERP